jgi:phenylalanyl-tRNA synthetase alpha subunit
MSGVWTEKSVPMTDHECAVEALEAVGGTILASNQNHIRLRAQGQEWSVQRSHGRYSIRYNRGVSRSSIAWMNELGPAYEKAVQAKLLRLRTEEEAANLESERAAIQAEREAFEKQRQDLIEERRQEILQKAKTLGYRVKETKENGQIRMVLVRTA